MKAVLCSEYGGPEKLGLGDVESPIAGPDEVVISVKAAGLNFFDTLIIENKYQFKPDLPFSPGAEVAGTIKSVGEGVNDLKPGDRVMAYTVWGGVREEIAVPTGSVIKMPEELEHEVAAGLIVTYGTSLHALKDRASIQPGETLAPDRAAWKASRNAANRPAAMAARMSAMSVW